MISPTIESCRTTIHGQFVNMRMLRVDDAERTLAWRMSPRAFLLNRGAETVESQARWISSRPTGELNYIIELKNQTPVGMVSLIDIDLTHRRAESARFLIGDEAAAKGVPAAVEAMKLLYSVAFECLKLIRVYGAVVEDNPLMLKWQLYLGMKNEGRLRKHLFLNDHFQDVISVGILEEEYRQVALPRFKTLIAMAARSPQPTPEER